MSGAAAVSPRHEPLIRDIRLRPSRKPRRGRRRAGGRTPLGVAFALSDERSETLGVKRPHASNAGGAGKLAAQGKSLDGPLGHAKDACRGG